MHGRSSVGGMCLFTFVSLCKEKERQRERRKKKERNPAKLRVDLQTFLPFLPS